MPGSKKASKPPKKRANREGTYEQLASGKWRVYCRIAGKKISGESKETREEAAESYRKALAAADGSAPDQASALSLSTFARNWAESRAKRLSPTTAETEGYWLKYIDKDPIGGKRIRDLTPRDLKGFPERIGVAKTTARNVCAWVNQILAAADCPHRVPVPAKARTTRRPLSPQERDDMGEMLAKLDEETRTCVLLCWLLGLRRSEACGLKHEDRDGEGVWIRRVVLVAKGHLILRAKTKTAKGAGWVPIPPVAAAMIGNGKTGFVVGGGDRPANPKALSQRLDEALRGHDLRDVPFLGLHTLRRTYGMTLLEAGVDPVTAAESMRHDPKMLLDEYSRSRVDLKSAGAKKAFESFKMPHQLPHEEAS